MVATVIHVMRHGEVDNPEGLLYGRLPGFALTERGHSMAQCVADSFVERGADLVAVVASPLKRAQQTAAPTAEAFGLELGSDSRLLEAGSFLEGMAVNANRLALAHPRLWKYYRAPLRPSWGEPYADVASRMSAALSHALQVAKGHEALLVSHQMPIVTLTRFARGQRLPHSPLSRQCSLASVTSFMFDGNTMVGISYDEPAGHLLEGALDMTPGNSAASLKR